MLSAACTMVQPANAPLGTEQNPVKLALAPSTDTEAALTAGEMLGGLIESETGLRVKLSVPTSHAAVVEAMATHNIDVGWLAPLAYVLAHDRVGAEPLVVGERGGSTTLAGQILVRADSGITGLEGLRGKRFAFADQTSLIGYHLPRALLLAQELDPADFFAETALLGGDDAVMLAVYRRQVDGGAVLGGHLNGQAVEAPAERTTFRPLPPDLAERLRVIARTDPIPNDVIGIRKDVPPEVVRQLRRGLLRLAARPDGAAALRELYQLDGLAPVTDADFAPVRAAVQVLHLDLDQHLAPRHATPAQ